MMREDKYINLRKLVRNIFYENNERYGYRRVHAVIKAKQVTISEKVICKIMKEEGLTAKRPAKRRYNSYKGEISDAPANIVNRNFHAEKPNQLWLTDITEFSILAGKVYLSPIIDCFDGMCVSWTISTHPNAELVNEMLDMAIEKLGENEHPISHSDRAVTTDARLD